MTQEDKDLLLKDLCGRLPYGVKVKITSKESKNRIVYLTEDNICHLTSDWWGECKPFLFPLSSMTEEQFNEMQTISGKDCLEHMEVQKSLRECTDFTHWPLYEYRVIDWFNQNHFDYRGLIPLGLAKDATGLNIY
jgi:hypothetical protein